MKEHAVYRLRQRRLQMATRPYLARGGSILRCPYCLLRQQDCICASCPDVEVKAGFCLLMYDSEPMKPSNTGRLIADIAPDSTFAFLWSRTEPDPELLRLLTNPEWQPFVIFPDIYASPEREVLYEVLPLTARTGRKPLFILLDGTWSEAKKMFRKSPYLDDFPLLSLRPEHISHYKLRSSANPEQLCTAEVAELLLDLHQETVAAQAMHTWFSLFRERALLTRFAPVAAMQQK